MTTPAPHPLTLRLRMGGRWAPHVQREVLAEIDRLDEVQRKLLAKVAELTAENTRLQQQRIELVAAVQDAIDTLEAITGARAITAKLEGFT
jgi:predicted transcriptional regulator